MDKDHLFRGKEIDAVLKSAARLQNKAEKVLGNEEQGLSLRELEMIAEEAGIDPRFLREAALLGDDETNENKFHIFGAPTTAGETFTIDKALSISERESLLEVFQKTVGRDGHVERTDSSLRWAEGKSKFQQPQLSVDLITDGDKTIARIKSKTWFIGFIIHYVLMLSVLFVGLPYLADAGWPSKGIALVVALFSIMNLPSRWSYRKFFDWRMGKVKDLKRAIQGNSKLLANKDAQVMDSVNLEYGEQDEEDHSIAGDKINTR